MLTLVQTGKSVPIPIVFIDRPGGDYWATWGLRQQAASGGWISRPIDGSTRSPPASRKRCAKCAISTIIITVSVTCETN